AEVAKIKAQNPQVLWSKLIGEYYDQQLSNLRQRSQGFWQAYAGVLSGDPAQGVRETMSYLPQDAQWTMTETRTQNAGPASASATYVTVRYPSLDTAPLVQSNLLMETMLEFQTRGSPPLVTDVAGWSRRTSPGEAPRMPI